MKITTEKQCQKALRILDKMIADGFQGDAKKERTFECLAKEIEAYQKRNGYFDLDTPDPKPIKLERA